MSLYGIKSRPATLEGMNLADCIRKACDLKLTAILAMRESLLEAWIAEHGCLPSDSVLCTCEEMRDGVLVTKCWVEGKPEL